MLRPNLFLRIPPPMRLLSFVLRSLEAARSLRDLAERGRVVPEFKDESIREILVHSYRLIYRVEENRVSVLALIHGRRDFASAWDERER